MKDKKYLHQMYNATSTDDGNGDLESYENWLERQLLSRIETIEEMEKDYFLFEIKYALRGNITQLVKAKDISTALDLIKETYPVENGYSFKLIPTLEC